MAVLQSLSTPNTVSKFFWFPSATVIASPAAGPTRAQIDAAEELTEWALSSIGGFDKQTRTVDFDLIGEDSAASLTAGSTFNPGEMVFGMDRAGAAANKDIRRLLTSGEAGYLLIAPGGDVEDYLAVGYRVSIGSLSNVIQAGQALAVRVSWSISAEFPNIELPAA